MNAQYFGLNEFEWRWRCSPGFRFDENSMKWRKHSTRLLSFMDMITSPQICG